MNEKSNSSKTYKQKFSQIEIPKIRFDRRTELVEFGNNNEFYYKLIEYSNKCALHHRILESLVNNIIGEGLTYDGELDAITEKLLNNPNPYETFDDIFKKITYDFNVFGGFALNIIWNNDPFRTGKRTISEIYHVDFYPITLGVATGMPYIEDYYYSNNWNKVKSGQETPIHYKRFIDINNLEDEVIDLYGTSQLFWYKSYQPGSTSEYFPLPRYIGALTAIETDIRISNFQLSSIKNGMYPGYSITMIGNYTQEEKDMYMTDFELSFNGDYNANRNIVNFVKNINEVPTYTPLEPKAAGVQFNAIKEKAMQDILAGHGIVSPNLVGIPSPVGLGGSTIIQDSWNIYNHETIIPIRNEILSALGRLTKIYGSKELKVKTSSPAGFVYSENVLKTILTEDEMRANIGLEPKVSESATPEDKNNQQI